MNIKKGKWIEIWLWGENRGRSRGVILLNTRFCYFCNVNFVFSKLQEDLPNLQISSFSWFFYANGRKAVPPPIWHDTEHAERMSIARPYPEIPMADRDPWKLISGHWRHQDDDVDFHRTWKGCPDKVIQPPSMLF